jgi:hypothetical protein
MLAFTRRLRLHARLLVGCAAFALLLTAPAVGHGALGSSVSYITFGGAVSLPGVVLPPGKYTFEALRSDIVRVSSRDGRLVLFTGYTYRVPRPLDPARDLAVSFGEGAANAPPPISVWYPEAGPGHQFIYR